MSLNKLIPPTIIFTDLDGTLLNYDDYGFDAAIPMLEFLKINKIPLIVVTSKTKDEMISLQKKLGLTTPFIIESGAGIVIRNADDYKILSLGYSYKKIRNNFKKYALKYKMLGFGDMSIKKIADITGLKYKDAKDAKMRLFTEPFILKIEKDYINLKRDAKMDDLDIVKSGRFYHLISLGQDKAVAVQKLISMYEQKYKMHFKTVALGDSANDLNMLNLVDVSILMPHMDGSYLQTDIKNLIKAPCPNSEGWNIALKKYFNV